MRTYVGSIAAVFVIVAAVYAYWSVTDRGGDPELDLQQPSTVGTTGRDDTGRASPGGFDPAPRKDTTQEELEFRGAGEPPQGPMPPLVQSAPLTGLEGMLEEPRAVAGRRIDLRDVEVESASGSTFVIREGDERATVIAPEGAPAVRAGERVNVSGTVEPQGNDSARIRATRVDVP